MVALASQPDIPDVRAFSRRIGSFVRDPARPVADIPAMESRGDKVAGRDVQAADEAEAWKEWKDMFRITRKLMVTRPDERLDYLHGVNPDLSEENLGQIVRITVHWLDSAARNRMRELVREHFDKGNTLSDILADWLTIEEAQRLFDIIQDDDVPDHDLAFCFAICEMCELAYGAFSIHRRRMRRKTDFTSINQTPEEVEADLRFANLR